MSIGSVVSGLKTASEILKRLVGLRDARMIEAEVAKLNAIVVAAQQSAAASQTNELALLEDKRQLKEQIVELERRASQREQYELTHMGGGTFAYTPKGGVKEGESAHAVCAKCYEGRHAISTLQFQHENLGRRVMKCPVCGEIFRFGEAQPLPPDTGRVGYSWSRRGRR